MITTVFMDVDDTLLDFYECARQAMQHAFAEIDIKFTDACFAVFADINRYLWAELEKGKISKTELYDKRWNLIFEKLNIKYDGRLFEKRFLQNLYNNAIPVPYADELLKYLYPNYKICITSNAPYNQQLERLRKADMLRYIYRVFTSEKIGFPKPQKEFFDACFADLSGVSKSEVMIIGDSLTADIQGGIISGIKTCWFNYRSQEIPSNMCIDFIVTGLEEIKNIL